MIHFSHSSLPSRISSLSPLLCPPTMHSVLSWLTLRVGFLSRWYSVCATELSTVLHLIHASCFSADSCQTSSVTQSASGLLDTSGSDCWAFSTAVLSFFHMHSTFSSPSVCSNASASACWYCYTSLLFSHFKLVWCFDLSCVCLRFAFNLSLTVDISNLWSDCK